MGRGVIGIVIVAHGGMAREFLGTVEYLFGPQDGIRAITIDPEHDRAGKQAEILLAADSVDTGDGVIVVTDMYGSSPANLSLPACACSNRWILYGVNLPMLVQLARSRHLTAALAVDRALEAGRKYINATQVRSPEGI